MRRPPERVVSEDELEMLMALYHLRYLTLPHLHQLFYPERTYNACSVRVARLTAAGYLQRDVYRVREGGAYSLDSEGLKTLRQFRGNHFVPTPELSTFWLPPHLSTDAVFAALAPQPFVAWHALPFRCAFNCAPSFYNTVPTAGP